MFAGWLPSAMTNIPLTTKTDAARMRKAFLTRDDDGEPAMLFFDKQEARGYCEADEEPDSLYTAADLELAKQEATRQAMERCAEACDDQEEPAWYGYENPNTFDDGKRACAKAIRALSNESEKRHG